MEKENLNSIKFNFTPSRFVPDDTSKGLFLFLIFQTLIMLVYQVVYMLGLTHDVWSYVFTLVLDACFIGCVYVVAKPRKIDMLSNLKVKKAPSLKQMLICVAISLICLFGFSALTNLFLEILYRAGYSSVTSDIVIPNFGYYLLYVVCICVAPAICEEILFRGLICNGLTKINKTVAVLGSAFLFMIMHGSPDQTVHQFILGIILALAFLATNNLWVPIIIHFLNNFVAVTFSYIAYGDSTAEATETAELYLGEFLIYAVISAVISGVLVYFLIKILSKSHKSENVVEPVEQKRPWELANGNQFEIDNSQYSVEFGTQAPEAGKMGEPEADPLAETPVVENKFTGAGKAMLIISVVWLVIDWVSALILGFTSVY